MTTSAIWLPMVNTGFRELMGSWKIIEISFPDLPQSLPVHPEDVLP
jgi:hypothetical protein